jgi:hypothetical protein
MNSFFSSHDGDKIFQSLVPIFRLEPRSHLSARIFKTPDMRFVSKMHKFSISPNSLSQSINGTFLDDQYLFEYESSIPSALLTPITKSPYSYLQTPLSFDNLEVVTQISFHPTYHSIENLNFVLQYFKMRLTISHH